MWERDLEQKNESGRRARILGRKSLGRRQLQPIRNTEPSHSQGASARGWLKRARGNNRYNPLERFVRAPAGFSPASSTPFHSLIESKPVRGGDRRRPT